MRSGASYLGLGRYVVNGRGRIRSRGCSGGGTFCNGAPQASHSSEGAWLMRIQWPRTAHSGLMHCTVQPGKYSFG